MPSGGDSPATATIGKPTEVPGPVEFRYTQSEEFIAVLHGLQATLLISTYQANKLLVVRANGQGLSTLVRSFDRPMGLAVDPSRLAVGTRKEVWFLRNAPDIAPQMEPLGMSDACYLPRTCHVTGDIGIHEMAWGSTPPSVAAESLAPGTATTEASGRDRALWIVSTRFSALCTLDPDYSFVPQWRPPFITGLAAEDRCHLNGLAMAGGQPKYVTALGTSDVRDGWRSAKPHGGCLIDVGSGEITSRGMCMPHSPRCSQGQLWVLESGTGGVVRVDPASGRRETVLQLPGFARGMAIAGPLAFVGMSKIRPTSAMDGVPLAERRDELRCGIAVVDLRRGATIAWLEFQSAVEEIFDVQLLVGVRFPDVIGFQKETLLHTFIVPRD